MGVVRWRGGCQEEGWVDQTREAGAGAQHGVEDLCKGGQRGMEEGPGEAQTLSAPAEREENSILGEGSLAGGCEKYASRTGWGGGGSPQLLSLSNLESGAGSLRVNCGGP